MIGLEFLRSCCDWAPAIPAIRPACPYPPERLADYTDGKAYGKEENADGLAGASTDRHGLPCWHA
ncbi:hypothetical protein MTBUT4_40103 [Magnetospirillum sp. UT-4]|nr:hypothetical protein MTBUT4_40103 [Magnetospirillum sp. UT-4]